jgi:hypothetical protein
MSEELQPVECPMCGEVMETAHVHAAGSRAFMTGAPLATEKDVQRFYDVIMSLPEAPAPEPSALDPTDPMYPSTVGLELVKRQGKTTEEWEQWNREWDARHPYLMVDAPPKRLARVMETLAGVAGAATGIYGMAVKGPLGPLVFMLTWAAAVLLWMAAFWWSMTHGPGWAVVGIALVGLPVGLYLISVAGDLLSGRGNDIGPEDWGP